MVHYLCLLILYFTFLFGTPIVDVPQCFDNYLTTYYANVLTNKMNQLYNNSVMGECHNTNDCLAHFCAILKEHRSKYICFSSVEPFTEQNSTVLINVIHPETGTNIQPKSCEWYMEIVREMMNWIFAASVLFVIVLFGIIHSIDV